MTFVAVGAGLVRRIASCVVCLAACGLALLAGAAPYVAKESAALSAYPVKTIRIIVASSPGTASDFFARSLGDELGAFGSVAATRR